MEVFMNWIESFEKAQTFQELNNVLSKENSLVDITSRKMLQEKFYQLVNKETKGKLSVEMLDFGKRFNVLKPEDQIKVMPTALKALGLIPKARNKNYNDLFQNEDIRQIFNRAATCGGEELYKLQTQLQDKKRYLDYQVSVKGLVDDKGTDQQIKIALALINVRQVIWKDVPEVQKIYSNCKDSNINDLRGKLDELCRRALSGQALSTQKTSDLLVEIEETKEALKKVQAKAEHPFNYIKPPELIVAEVLKDLLIVKENDINLAAL